MTNPSKRKGRSFRFYFFYSLSVLVFVLVASEIGLRVAGHGPWVPSQQRMQAAPCTKLFQPDSVLGFAGCPGLHTVALNGSLRFRMTHGANGFRVNPVEPDTAQRPEVWVLGCSFTHGFGVDDSATWPWKLQAALPGYRVRNYGMTAYGTWQSLLLLDRLLDTAHVRPALVVLAYGAFHDQRNTSNRFWRKALSGQQTAEGLRYPHVRFSAGDVLEEGYSHLEYSPFWGQSSSALVHWAEIWWNHREDASLRSNAVARILIERMDALCQAVGSRFALAGIYRHPETAALLDHFAGKGIPTKDISQDLEQPGLRILPEDGHPNPAAHSAMAAAAAPFVAGLLRQ